MKKIGLLFLGVLCLLSSASGAMTCEDNGNGEACHSRQNVLEFSMAGNPDYAKKRSFWDTATTLSFRPDGAAKCTLLPPQRTEILQEPVFPLHFYTNKEGEEGGPTDFETVFWKSDYDRRNASNDTFEQTSPINPLYKKAFSFSPTQQWDPVIRPVSEFQKLIRFNQGAIKYWALVRVKAFWDGTNCGATTLICMKPKEEKVGETKVYTCPANEWKYAIKKVVAVFHQDLSWKQMISGDFFRSLEAEVSEIQSETDNKLVFNEGNVVKPACLAVQNETQQVPLRIGTCSK